MCLVPTQTNVGDAAICSLSLLLFQASAFTLLIRVITAFVSGAGDLSLISRLVQPMTIKLVFTASLLDAQHHRESVGDKSGGVLVPLEKAFGGIPSSYSGRQMAGNS